MNRRSGAYILRTYYLRKSVTWIKILSVAILLSVLILRWIPFLLHSVIYAYIIIAVLIPVIFLSPVDDLAVDRSNFYHLKSSLIPLLSKRKIIKISDIKSWKCKGTYSKGLDILNPFMPGNTGIYSNEIHLELSNGSVTILQVGVYKSDIAKILTIAESTKGKTIKSGFKK